MNNKFNPKGSFTIGEIPTYPTYRAETYGSSEEQKIVINEIDAGKCCQQNSPSYKPGQWELNIGDPCEPFSGFTACQPVDIEEDMMPLADQDNLVEPNQDASWDMVRLTHLAGKKFSDRASFVEFHDLCSHLTKAQAAIIADAIFDDSKIAVKKEFKSNFYAPGGNYCGS